MRTVPLSEAKDKLSEFAGLVEREHERIVVTRNGRPSFVVVDVEDLDSLEATLEILSDPDAMASIREYRADLASGRLVTFGLDELPGA
jgi:prevent-host-death family protein